MTSGRPKWTSRQEGGDHYSKMAIQPMEYIIANKLLWCEGEAIAHVSRHRDKGGRLDLEKAIHYIEAIIETEYPQVVEE